MHAQSSLTTLSAADRRIDQLADAMFELHASGADVTRSLLRAEGFSNHELDTYGEAARRAAEKRFVRVEQPAQGFTKTDDEVVRIAVDAGMGLIGDAAIVSAFLRRGLTPAQIDRNWSSICRKLGMRIGTLPTPELVA